jgi:hypothetical protein
MSPKYMPTSASSSLATRRSAVISRLRMPAITSGLVANTRTRHVTTRLVRAMRRRSEEASLKFGLMLGHLILENRPMKQKKARRGIRPKANRGREDSVFVVLIEATSLKKICFSSVSKFGGRSFSSDLSGRDARVRTSSMDRTVAIDPGLSSLYTMDSVAITSFPISSTIGKNESTIDPRIPWAIQAEHSAKRKNKAPVEIAYRAYQTIYEWLVP